MKNTIVRYVSKDGSCVTTDRPSQEQGDYFKFSVGFSLITIYSHFFMNVFITKKSYSVKKNQSIRALFTPHEFKLFFLYHNIPQESKP